MKSKKNIKKLENKKYKKTRKNNKTRKPKKKYNKTKRGGGVVGLDVYKLPIQSSEIQIPITNNKLKSQEIVINDVESEENKKAFDLLLEKENSIKAECFLNYYWENNCEMLYENGNNLPVPKILPITREETIQIKQDPETNSITEIKNKDIFYPNTTELPFDYSNANMAAASAGGGKQTGGSINITIDNRELYYNYLKNIFNKQTHLTQSPFDRLIIICELSKVINNFFTNPNDPNNAMGKDKLTFLTKYLSNTIKFIIFTNGNTLSVDCKKVIKKYTQQPPPPPGNNRNLRSNFAPVLNEVQEVIFTNYGNTIQIIKISKIKLYNDASASLHATSLITPSMPEAIGSWEIIRINTIAAYQNINNFYNEANRIKIDNLINVDDINTNNINAKYINLLDNNFNVQELFLSTILFCILKKIIELYDLLCKGKTRSQYIYFSKEYMRNKKNNDFKSEYLNNRDDNIPDNCKFYNENIIFFLLEYLFINFDNNNSIIENYKKIIIDNGNDIIPHNTLINFKRQTNNTFGISFVNSIPDIIKELVFTIFKTIYFGNEGIIKMDTQDLTILPPPEYKRVNTSNDNLVDIVKFDTDIKKINPNNIDNKQFSCSFKKFTPQMKPEGNIINIINTGENSILLNGLKKYLNHEREPNDYLVLTNPDYENIILYSSIMSQLVYLPTYDIIVSNKNIFNNENIKYFGAYYKDPDIPQIDISYNINNNYYKNITDVIKEGLNKDLIKDEQIMYEYPNHLVHVWIDNINEHIYMANRGTKTGRDWVTADVDITLGSGFQISRIRDIKPILRDIYKRLISYSTEKYGVSMGIANRNKYKLIIAGHSMGGFVSNATSVITYQNKLYNMDDTFTSGFPITFQPFYSPNGNNNEQINILNWGLKNTRGLILNVEGDAAAQNLIDRRTDIKYIDIYEITRIDSQRSHPLQSNMFVRTYDVVLYMGLTHSLYNWFGSQKFNEIFYEAGKTEIHFTGEVDVSDNYIKHDYTTTISDIVYKPIYVTPASIPL